MEIAIIAVIVLLILRRNSSTAVRVGTTGPGGGGGNPAGTSTGGAAATSSDGIGSSLGGNSGPADSLPNLNLPPVVGPGSTPPDPTDIGGAPNPLPDPHAGQFFQPGTGQWVTIGPITNPIGVAVPVDNPSLNPAPPPPVVGASLVAQGYGTPAANPAIAYQSGGPGSVVSGEGSAQFYIAPNGQPLAIDPSSGRTAEYYNSVFNFTPETGPGPQPTSGTGSILPAYPANMFA